MEGEQPSSRKWTRVPYPCSVALICQEGKIVEVDCRDLSVAGMGIRSHAPLREGEQLCLMLNIGERRLALRAQVMRAGLHGGLRFVELDECALQTLHRLISNAQPFS